MFFIGIFGIEGKEKHIKDFSNVVCPDCGRLTSASLYEQHTYFHFFFIPTFKWNRHYYVKLRCCGTVYEADAEYGKALKSADTIDFARMKKVRSGFGSFENTTVTCANCGKTSDKSYAFCPYCGTKL